MRQFFWSTWLLFFVVNTFASQSYRDLLQSINFLTVANYTFQYQPSYKLQILDSENSKFNEIAYLVDKQHAKPESHLVEINTQTHHLQINQKPYDVNTHDLAALFSNKPFYFMNDTLGKTVQATLKQTYDIDLEPLYDRTLSERLESKSNTCQAMLDLKEQYKYDAKMSYYLNLFFPETGFVESVDHLKQLMQSHEEQGIVFKLDKGDGTRNVFVACKNTLITLLDHKEPLAVISERLSDIKNAQALQQAIENKELIWQEYLAIVSSELSFQFYKQSPGSIKLGTFGFNLMQDHHFLGAAFTPINKKQLFENISPEAFDYFERIANALINTKTRLTLGYSQGIKTTDDNLKIIGFDILPIKDNGHIIPKISEINPRMTGGTHLAQGFFNLPKQVFTEGKMYLGITTDFIPINPNLSAADFSEKFNHAFSVTFEKTSSSIHVELSRLLIQQSFTAFEAYISFYPLLPSQQKEAFQLMQNFTNALWQAFSQDDM